MRIVHSPRLAAAIAALFALLSVSATHAMSLTFPPLTGRVVDDAGVLSDDTKTRLTGILAQLEQKTGDQVVVATLKSLQGDDIADYGYKLGRAWGIGQKKKNNGAILIVVPSEHKVRIEVGYGLEGTVTDALSKLIIENTMLPQFRSGNYDAGVEAGTVELVRLLGGNTVDLSHEPRPPPPEHHDGGSGIGIVIALILIWIIFGRFFWPLLFVGGRNRWGGGGFGGWGGGFGGSGGSFGGGGFSGGGGSFGGGGASGSW